jgi:hypothetical protein
MVLHLMTCPIYAAAVVAAAFRRPLNYVVTAKGELSSPDSLSTFRAHFGWLALTVAALAAGALRQDTPPFVIFWATFALVATIVPLLLYALAKPKPSIEVKKPSTEDPPQKVAKVGVPLDVEMAIASSGHDGVLP